jgi:hypothetical protein
VGALEQAEHGEGTERLGFQRRHQPTAVPLDWRSTRSDLDLLLHRLDEQRRPAAA